MNYAMIGAFLISIGSLVGCGGTSSSAADAGAEPRDARTDDGGAPLDGAQILDDASLPTADAAADPDAGVARCEGSTNWSAPFDIGDGTSFDDAAAFVVDLSQVAHVVFCEGERVRRVRHLYGSGEASSWSSEIIAADGDVADSCSPVLAVAPSGALHLVYRGQDGQLVHRERAVGAGAWEGGPIDAARPVAPPPSSVDLGLEIEPGGEVDVFYMNYVAEPYEYGLRVARRDTEGTWTNALLPDAYSTDLEREPIPMGVPDAVWHGGGLAVLYAMRIDSESLQVMVGRRDSAGGWTREEVTRTAGLVGWWRLESAAGSLHLAFTHLEYDEDASPLITLRDMVLGEAGWQQGIALDAEQPPLRWDSALDERGGNHFLFSTHAEDAVYHRWREGTEGEWNEEIVARESVFYVRAALAADRLHVIYRSRYAEESEALRYVTRCLR